MTMIESTRAGSGRRMNQSIASFLLKTYEILEHPENRKIICWDKDDVGFIVLDVLNFTREILPKYFRHSNFSSFVRQLNMYDFHKVKQETNMLVFKNPLFCRGEQHKLRFIKRKASRRNPAYRRQFSNGSPEFERTTSAYKWLKRSIEGQINYSLLYLQKTLELINDNNHSNSQKQQRINELKADNKEEQLDSLYQLREECEVQVSRTLIWLDQFLEIYRRKIKNMTNFNAQLAQSRRQEENKTEKGVASEQKVGQIEQKIMSQM